MDSEQAGCSTRRRLRSDNLEVAASASASVAASSSASSGEAPSLEPPATAPSLVPLPATSSSNDDDKMVEGAVGFQIKRCEKEKCMMANAPYYVSEDLEKRIPEIMSKPDKAVVEVPSWRKVPIEKLKRPRNEPMEEDISEATVSKRHARFEVEEKRLNRLFFQRLREEKYLEGLKKRMERRRSQKKGKPGDAAAASSTETSEDEEGRSEQDLLEKISKIRVADDLPVSVFKCPLPNVPKSEFRLPWMKSCEKDTQEGDEEEEDEAVVEEENEVELIDLVDSGESEDEEEDAEMEEQEDTTETEEEEEEEDCQIIE